MNSVCKDIFRSIHEGKWLSIEYKNKQEIITKYWIAIKDININCNLLKVDGLHIGQLTITEFDIHIESILSSSLIDGSYCEKNEELIYDISLNHEKYQHLFNNIANLKILNYLSDCNRMDCTPYKCEYSLIEKIDLDILENGSLALDKAQFESIVKEFQNKSSNNSSKFKIKNLCMNILSINTPKGLYVLAYKKLQLDVKNRLLKTEDNITISNEFTINGEKQSIRQFLDAEDYYLVENFTKNSELIKDRITFYSKLSQGVDDMPYIIGIGKDITVDLNYDYNGLLDMYEKNDVTYPIKGFFGDITARPIRIKNFPIVLLNKKVNIDQLLAINTSIKYPIAYVQGPPGTGKTNTIINTISTAFFNEKTVLFTSYNNHPIDGVFAVFYLTDAVAVFNSFSSAEPKTVQL